ncbi:MAG TPA: hypothetical protein VM900_13430 [Sphingomonas sp.]|nr:hypothetical protein [Sphingomonas sp.]
MAEQHSVKYLQSRETFERELAARASHPRAAEIHLELAETYSRLAAGGSQSRTPIEG